MMADADRAKLNFDDDDLTAPAPAPVPVAKIVEATRKAGFRETPRAAKVVKVEEPIAEPTPTRRARLKTGRVHQFATRLRRETIDALHAYADAHGITVAETLERAQRALADSEKASS